MAEIEVRNRNAFSGDLGYPAQGGRLAMFDRIVSDLEILGGKPCVKGTRISVEFLLELVAQGAGRDDILKAYPHLTAADVEQAMRYASRFLENEVVISAEIRG